MNEEPQPVAGHEVKSTHDGRAAVAIALVTIGLIAWLVYNLV